MHLFFYYDLFLVTMNLHFTEKRLSENKVSALIQSILYHFRVVFNINNQF